MRRTPMKPRTEGIRPVSKRRQRVNRVRRQNLVEAWGPRPWKCAGAGLIDTPCFGPVNAHEIVSRARSGKDENLINPTGMVPLCDHHNGWVEDNPNEAYELGLARHGWEAA